MKVLVLGSGAREHAIAAHLQRSRSVSRVILAPGNGLAARSLETLPVEATDPAAVVALAKRVDADFVIVGAEAPLLAGVVDALQAAKFPVLGPTQAAARLEGSKAFAKRVMQEAGVPTARFATFTDANAAVAWLDAHPGAYAVKADGLMAGKGVIMSENIEEAAAAARELFAAGQTQLVIEQRLRGREVSLIGLCDGTRTRLFPLARDHKRLLTGDLGKNTGGMGAFCPVVLGASEFEALPVQTPEQLGELCITPILRQMKKAGHPFRGFLFAGLMFDEGKPYVLEYNARLGDPETQVLLNTVDGDLTESFYAAAVGELGAFPACTGASVCVVLAARGYPDKPITGDVISGLDRSFPHVSVYGAGVMAKDGELVTAGGRVLSVVGHGANLREARTRAYDAAAQIHFEGMQLRTDIAGLET